MNLPPKIGVETDEGRSIRVRMGDDGTHYLYVSFGQLLKTSGVLLLIVLLRSRLTDSKVITSSTLRTGYFRAPNVDHTRVYAPTSSKGPRHPQRTAVK